MDDRYTEMMKELAKKKELEDKESKSNPLSEYSTTQLKAELRRRKRK